LSEYVLSLHPSSPIINCALSKMCYFARLAIPARQRVTLESIRFNPYNHKRHLVIPRDVVGYYGLPRRTPTPYILG